MPPRGAEKSRTKNPRPALPAPQRQVVLLRSVENDARPGTSKAVLRPRLRTSPRLAGRLNLSQRCALSPRRLALLMRLFSYICLSARPMVLLMSLSRAGS